MGGSHKQTGNEIFVFGRHARLAFAAAFLRFIGIQRHAFDIAGFGNGNHHFFTLNQRFNVGIILNVFNFGAARRAIFIANSNKFVTHNAVKFFTAGQNRQAFFDFFADSD